MAVRVLVAILMGAALLWSGMKALRVASAMPGSKGPGDLEGTGAEDVYLVCGECGTEFRVEKVGEGGVPRHCGERMRVVRRPVPGS